MHHCYQRKYLDFYFTEARQSIYNLYDTQTFCTGRRIKPTKFIWSQTSHGFFDHFSFSQIHPRFSLQTTNRLAKSLAMEKYWKSKSWPPFFAQGLQSRFCFFHHYLLNRSKVNLIQWLAGANPNSKISLVKKICLDVDTCELLVEVHKRAREGAHARKHQFRKTIRSIIAQMQSLMDEAPCPLKELVNRFGNSLLHKIRESPRFLFQAHASWNVLWQGLFTTNERGNANGMLEAWRLWAIVFERFMQCGSWDSAPVLSFRCRT